MAITKYYDFGPILSRNAVWNFLCGARGLGKTWGWKHLAIKGYIKRKEQFIYLRRYKEEVNKAKGAFFADIADKFPDYEFQVKGDEALMRARADGDKAPYEVIGFFVALSTARRFRSVSFHRVRRMVYDEFIIDKGLMQYLPGEAAAFLDFFMTVDRYADRCTVFFIANSVAVNNPYFIEHDILPTKDKEWMLLRDGFICAHFPDSKAFASEVYETRLGKFIAGSEYADYAVGNEFADNHRKLIEQKTSAATYAFTLQTRKGTFSVWREPGPRFFVQKKRPSGQERRYTLLPDQVGDGVRFMETNDEYLKILRAAFKNNKLVFDKIPTRHAFTEIFKR